MLPPGLNLLLRTTVTYGRGRACCFMIRALVLLEYAWLSPRSTTDVTARSGTRIDQGRPVRVGGPGRFRFPELGYRRRASHRGSFRERWPARRCQATPREGATIPRDCRVDSERFSVPIDKGETCPPSRHAPLSLP